MRDGIWLFTSESVSGLHPDRVGTVDSGFKVKGRG